MWLLATTLTLSSEMLVLILYAELKNKVSRELPLSITGQVLRFQMYEDEEQFRNKFS